MKTPAPQRAAGRRKLAAEDKALPDGTAPIPNLDYLRRAIRSKGRVDPSKWPALKALIRKRARELGALDAPGVKGTWAFEGAGDAQAIELVGPHGYIHGWIKAGPGAAPGGKPSADALRSMSPAEKKAYIKTGALPARLKISSSPASAANAKRDLVPPPLTKPDLVRHMTEHHTGGPVGGRHVGPKKPTAAQMAAGHAEQHQQRSDLSHTHGETKPPSEVFYHGSPRQLKPGDYIDPKHASPGVTRLQEGKQYAFMSRDPGEARFFDKSGGRGHLYKVVPEGSYEPDPHLREGTSMRSTGRLRVVSEVGATSGPARPDSSMTAAEKRTYVRTGKRPARLTAHANDQEAVELATTRRMPVVRGTPDVQASRTSPSAVTVMHRSTGMKIGTVVPAAHGGHQGVHADGTKTPASATMGGAMAGLIAYHNKAAAKKAAPSVKQCANGEQQELDLAGALPYTSAASSSDGPRVTTMGGGKKAKTVKPDEVKAVYAKLLKRGMKPAQALALAKRAAAMHAKAA